MDKAIEKIFKESISVKERTLETSRAGIIEAVQAIRKALRANGKVLLCGNGGSAADSQHIAAELVGRFRKERRALAAIALTTDTSILTSVGNDYGYEQVFARQVEALGAPGDVAIGISTSGNSKNVIAALAAAKKLNMTTVSLTGGDGGALAKISDININVPSKDTARVQETHICVGHVLCELVEA